MKKFLVLLAALILISGLAFADDLGFTAGLEFGIFSANDDARLPYLMGIFAYENAFFKDALDVYTELDYTLGLKKDSGKLPTDLWWDVALGYNFFFSDVSTLSILAENEIDFAFTPSSGVSGIFTPAVQYKHGFGFGDIYGKIGFPISYEKDNTDLGLDFTVGWDSTFGLGLKVIESNQISGGFGFNNVELTVSFSADSFFGKVAATFPGDIAASGIQIKPWFEYYFSSFTFYVYCTFDGIGSDPGISISPALGVLFSF